MLLWTVALLFGHLGFPGGSNGKESACNARDLNLILGSGRSPGEGNGYPLQYSCLENPTDSDAWQAIVHGVTKIPCVGKTVWLRPQARPYLVFEGDILTLRCRERKNAALSQVTFYRDGKFLHFSKNNQPLFLGRATANSSARYDCTRRVTHTRNNDSWDSGTAMVQVQELFPPPVLTALPSHELCEGSPVTLRCQTKLYSRKLAKRLLFSFHKEDRTLQNRGPRPELHIPAAKEGDSGLYWCKASPEGVQVQKQSPQLELRVWAPVSRPLLTLRPTSLVVGDEVELLCEAQRGSPPILYSFHLNGDILRNHVAPHGGPASCRFRVMSEQDAGSYSCEAGNRVSRETSEPETLSVYDPQVLSAPRSSNWLVPWLSASLLAMMFIAAVLLGYFRPWRKNAPKKMVEEQSLVKDLQEAVTGPLPPRNLPSAPGGEQHPLYVNVHRQNENNEEVIYSEIHTIPREHEASPAQSAQQEKDISVIYAKVRHSQLKQDPLRSY